MIPTECDIPGKLSHLGLAFLRLRRSATYTTAITHANRNSKAKLWGQIASFPADNSSCSFTRTSSNTLRNYRSLYSYDRYLKLFRKYFRVKSRNRQNGSFPTSTFGFSITPTATIDNLSKSFLTLI